MLGGQELQVARQALHGGGVGKVGGGPRDEAGQADQKVCCVGTQ